MLYLIYKKNKRRNNVLKNRKAINITLPLDLIDKAKEKAKADNRKFTNYIENLIKKDLK